MTQFGEGLKAARQARRWTQKDVAQQLAITDVAYGDYERGRNFPTPENLRLLCEIFAELDFDAMDRLIEQEKKWGQRHRAKQRVDLLKPPPDGAASPSRSRTAFVVNTGQEVPITMQEEPVLSSHGMITLEIDLHMDHMGAKLDVIDLRSVTCLKTFELPVHFLRVDVSGNPAYTPLLEQMKQHNLPRHTLSKAAFAFRLWWPEAQPGA